MPRIDIASLTPWITRAAVLHGTDLPVQLMQHLGVSRRSAGHALRKLAAAQWLVAEGTPRKPLYRPGALRQVVQRYALSGLQEDRPWRRDFAPFFALPPEVARMAQHAFTELLNNAIEHSGGSQVTVSMRQTPLQLQLLVSDDGVGLFDRIAGSFALDDPVLAMLELSKGKLTSQPQCHSGHGLFFSSRLADVFDIHANRSAFQHRAWESQAWRPGKASAANTRPGTAIYLAIALDTPRTLDAVLRAHSDTGAGYDFARTRVPLHLIADQDALLSRADARRASLRLAQFARAELDFAGVAHIGHGFADELFRVYAREHPGVELLPVAMSPQVTAMIDSVR
jgi:anti-sigma regulatory factor (Ser/Thr protein kinase)